MLGNRQANMTMPPDRHPKYKGKELGASTSSKKKQRNNNKASMTT